MATYVRVQATGAGSASPLNLSFGSLPAAGNAIFVKAAFNLGIGTTAVVDNQGNTYTKAVTANRVGFQSEVWYAWNIGSPSGTFTVTISGASTVQGQAEEWSGFGTLTPLFTTGSFSGAFSNTVTAAIPTLNPTSVGIFCGMCANIQTASINAPWTTDFNFFSFGSFGGHRLISSSGSQSISITTSGGWSGALAIFQDPADFSAVRATQITESFVAATTSPVRATQIVESLATTSTGAVRATQVVLTLITQAPTTPAEPFIHLPSVRQWGLQRFDIKTRSEDSS